MPIDSIGMNIYDPQTHSIVKIASAGISELQLPHDPITLSDEAVKAIENDRSDVFEIINRLEDDRSGT